MDGHQAYQFRRVEAGVDVLRVALDKMPGAAQHLIADLQKDLLLLGVMLPASSSPEPKEPVCDAGVPGESAPSKVWAVQFVAPKLYGEMASLNLFSSLAAADHYIEGRRDLYRITEYEVADA